MSAATSRAPPPAPETFTRRAAIVGRVSDAVTGADVAGAVVQITAMPADFAAWLASYRIPYGKAWPLLARRPDRTETAADGSYVFCDLPAGEYELTAALPRNGGRYADNIGNAAVPSAGYADCDIALSPTTVEGIVRSSEALTPAASAGAGTGIGTGVLMAIVRVAGSGETTETAADGSYRLVAIQPGTRRISVTANGFAPDERQVDLAPAGKVLRGQDFSLMPATAMPANRRER